MVKIGIITATYNRPELLDRLHRSLAEQGNKAVWCHYVVDDGSKVDYSEVFKKLQKLTNRIHTKRISNSGALIARNNALEMAISEDCTHLCFVDDDDIFLPGSVAQIEECIRQNDSQNWFVFASKKGEAPKISWPNSPIEMSWFDDVVLKRRLGSDNLIVVGTDLIGDVRFSTRGRNQREWTFFLTLCRKNDRVLVMPDALLEKNYQSDGLTAQTQKGRYKPEQVFNSVERAIKYWWLRPVSPQLFLQAIKQVGAAPIKLILYRISRK